MNYTNHTYPNSSVTVSMMISESVYRAVVTGERLYRRFTR